MDLEKLSAVRPARMRALPSRYFKLLCFYLYAYGHIETPWASINRSPYPKEMNAFHHAAECVYIHIPKTGGASARRIVFGDAVADRFGGHIFASEFRASDPDRFDRYFVFATVRHPYDRLKSAFWFLKEGGIGMRDRIWSRRNLGRFETFRDFVLALKEPDFQAKILAFMHFIPQSRFLCDEHGQLLVPHLVRIENFESDLVRVCEQLGVPYSPRHVNQTRNKPETKDRDDDLRAICKQIYASDYAVLGYE